MSSDDLYRKVTQSDRPAMDGWLLVLRGVAAILFGIFALAMPAATVLALVILFGLYALVEGVLNLVLAARRGREGHTWGWLLFEGITGVVGGALILIWPGMTLLVMVILLAVRAVLMGFAEIAAAVKLRHNLNGEWLMALGGIFSIVFGGLLLLTPGAGVLAIVWMMAGWAFVFGVLLIATGLRLNFWPDDGDETHRATGTPVSV